MGFITLKEYVERHEIIILQCAYCGKRLSEDQVVWLGCCPLCRDCHKALRKRP